MVDFSPALQGYEAGMETNARLPTPAQRFLEQLNVGRQQDIEKQRLQNEAQYRNAFLGLQGEKNQTAAEHWMGMVQAAQQRNDIYGQDVVSKAKTREEGLGLKKLNFQSQDELRQAQVAWLQTKAQLQPDLSQSQVQANLARAGLAGAQTTKTQQQVSEPNIGEVLRYFDNRNKQIDDENSMGMMTPNYQPQQHIGLSDAYGQVKELKANDAAGTPGQPSPQPGAQPSGQPNNALGDQLRPLVGQKTKYKEGTVLSNGATVHVDPTGTITGFDIPPSMASATSQ